MLEELYAIQNRIVKTITLDFKRYLYESINWDNRLIALIGARGVGKTTLVLQHYLEKYNEISKCFYFSADNPIVLKEGLYWVADSYLKMNGDCVIIDEVHKQSNWSSEIKALYDSWPDKKIIILGSSALNILGKKGDLSRRVVAYKLRHLSFREYINFKYNLKLEDYTFDEICNNHLSISRELTGRLSHILKDFSDFLRHGAYPFIKEHTEDEYYILLNNILDKVIYEDIPSISSIIASSSLKIKKLIGYLALSKIPTLSINSLTSEIGLSKEKLYEFLDLLERADVINIIKTGIKNTRTVKDSRIFFCNPNFYYAIAHEMWKHDAEKGNIRESFFAGGIGGMYDLYVSKKLDFRVVDREKKLYEIEIGGRSKDRSQLKGVDYSYLFKDDIEFGNANIVPLYLAGFLY